MAEKQRVFQVAKTLNVESSEILDALSDMGKEVTSNLAQVDADTIEELKVLFKPKPESAKKKVVKKKIVKKIIRKVVRKKVASQAGDKDAAAEAGTKVAAGAAKTTIRKKVAAKVAEPAPGLPGQPSQPAARAARPGGVTPPRTPAAAGRAAKPDAPALVAPPPAVIPSHYRPSGGPGGSPAGAKPGAAQRPGAQRPAWTPRPPMHQRRRARRKGGPPTPEPRERKPAKPEPPLPKEVTLTEGVTVKELSEKLNRKGKDIIRKLMDMGTLVTINQPLDPETVNAICKDLGVEVKMISFEEEVEELIDHDVEEGTLEPRPPVVTVMGHVDHGKTSLLDAIKETNVVAKEHGGITQHIGAYHVEIKNRSIVFLDTPGHEAFTLMRARGAQVTDIVVLVVAADDGVKPQTIEAIDHAKAAEVPIIVAINKIDKPEAQVDRVKQQLSEHGLLAEDWGGDVVTVQVSAKKKTGLDSILEMILLVADLKELKASKDRTAIGTILEARLDRTRGPVATVLIQNGTIKVGQPFIAGAVPGKVRAMFDDLGQSVRSAGPSTPVEILGLQDVPNAGDRFQVMEDETKVRQISNFRQEKLRQEKVRGPSRLTLDHLHQQIAEGSVKELPLIVKADVQGSVEVLSKALEEQSNEQVRLRVLHSATGAITETDVLFASASNAIIIGFNVRPERTASDLAEKEGVDIRLHTVIYNVTNEIKNAMTGLLEPTFREAYLGRAEVRQTFKVPKIGVIAGCAVIDGKITRSAEVRLLRDNVVVYEGRISSLRRFKDDASEVKSGFECGIGLEKYSDLKIDDVIEAFTMEKVAPVMVGDSAGRGRSSSQPRT